MSALTGQAPKDTYLDLLHMGRGNLGFHPTTPTVIYDGAGNETILWLAQDSIAVDGVFTASVAGGVTFATGITLEVDAITTGVIEDPADATIAMEFTSADPEGALTRGVGSLALRKDTGVLNVKGSGVGNTGWNPVPHTFLDLPDVPGTFQAQRWVKVNVAGNALEFVTADLLEAPAGSAQGEVLFYNGSSWTNLGVGTAGQVLKSGGAAADVSWGDESGGGASDFLTLSDTPGSYSGQDGKAVAVNGTALVFQDFPVSLPSGVQGNVLYHNGADWVVLAPGTAGHYLRSYGAAANVAWAALPTELPSGATGDILYNAAGTWTVLNPGTSGYVLTSQGVGSAVQWAASSGGGATTFTALTDTPASHGSDGDYYLRSSGSSITATNVNAMLTQDMDTTPSDGHILVYHGAPDFEAKWEAPSFIGGSDTPASYSGQAGKFLKVNAGATALEFTDAPSGGGGYEISSTAADTGKTWNSGSGSTEIYSQVLYDGVGHTAGTNNIDVSTAVDGGIYRIVEIRVLAFDDDTTPTTTWDASTKETADSWVYDYANQRLVHTCTGDTSGDNYTVIVEFIKAAGPLTGDPHVIVTLDSAWGVLGAGAHVLTPSSYTDNTGSWPTGGGIVEKWRWDDTVNSYWFSMSVTVSTSTTTSTGGTTTTTTTTYKKYSKFYAYDGTSYQDTAELYESATSALAPFAIVDSRFKSYALAGANMTIARATDWASVA